MNKPWLVWDSGNGNIEEYDTEAEALAYAEESLKLYREEACQEGEWHDEVESMAVYKLAHNTVVVERGGDEENDEPDWVEYGIQPVPDIPNYRGIMENDILSAIDDCIDLGMDVKSVRDVIRAIVAKAIAP